MRKTEEKFIKEGFGIKVTCMARETPQYNGIVERAFATLFGRVRAMMDRANIGGKLSKGLWNKCAATATKLNNMLVDAPDGKSLFKKFYGEIPKYAKYLRTFGEIGIATTSNTSMMKGKLIEQGTKCMFVGCTQKHDGDIYKDSRVPMHLYMFENEPHWAFLGTYESVGV